MERPTCLAILSLILSLILQLCIVVDLSLGAARETAISHGETRPVFLAIILAVCFPGLCRRGHWHDSDSDIDIDSAGHANRTNSDNGSPGYPSYKGDVLSVTSTRDVPHFCHGTYPRGLKATREIAV